MLSVAFLSPNSLCQKAFLRISEHSVCSPEIQEAHLKLILVDHPCRQETSLFPSLITIFFKFLRQIKCLDEVNGWLEINCC